MANTRARRTRWVACRECGGYFTSIRRQMICSIECRRARTARRRAAMFTDAERLAIFERDGWTCGICGHPVDPDLSLPDVMSAAVDHIVPFARGGRHDPANAQCSHWICNARKYTGRSATQASDIAPGA